MSQPECCAPLRPMPVKRLAAIAVLMVIACTGGYLLSPKWQAVQQEQARLADPLHAFSDENMQEKQLLSLQSKIRANPQDSTQWAQLGEYYLGKTRIIMRYWPMSRRCVCAVKTPRSIRHWRRCCTISPGSI